ncbi:uncharacterized protein [Nicotiana sylvestris]|uniref:uncharacterized protein n=1 Tax=Nicotiana sylvestris TaxID=4096 RepID=UPI00388C6E79
MGNNATTKIEGYGKIFLKITSGKVLTLNNVLHVPTIRKNLVSISLLVKNGFKCVFVSDKVVVIKNEIYATNSKAYWFLVHKSDNPEIQVNTVMKSDNAEFFESICPYKTECESLNERPKQPREEPKENTPNFVTFLLENEPQTFKAAMSSSDSAFWKEAVNSEIQSILDNQTWELVDLHPGNKLLGSK